MLDKKKLLTALTVDQLKLVVDTKKIKGGASHSRPLTGIYAQARPLTGMW